MWSRKNQIERGIDSLETGTAAAVEDLAATIRERYDNETGRKLASNLASLAKSVDQLDLSDSVQKRRRELERAARKASRQMDRAIKDLERTRSKVARDATALATRVGESVDESTQQLATLGQKTVPTEPTGWIMPTFFGFLLGFGAGFLVGRKQKSDQHA